MTQSQLDARLDSFDKQIKKLFSMFNNNKDIVNAAAQVLIADSYDNIKPSQPTDIELTQAHEWRKAHERVFPPRESQYGAQYYRPTDLDKILAEYKRS